LPLGLTFSARPTDSPNGSTKNRIKAARRDPEAAREALAEVGK
jgi:hypothetical protein